MPIFLPEKGWKGDGDDFKMEETYKGCVLALGSNSSCGDSDYYAIVWDEEKQSIEHICYDTTRGYSVGSAKVDATPEVKEKAKAYKYKERLKWWQNQNKEQSRIPEVGREVEIIRGGYTNEDGTIFWKGPSKRQDMYFGKIRGPLNMRLGIQTSAGKRIFVGEDDVEVIDPERYEKPVNPEGDEYARGCTGQKERWEYD